MHTHRRRRRDRRGFTLLEVLLVLVILGVIAALVVPQLTGTQERALIMATRTKLKTIEAKAEAYAIEHGTQYPETLDELLAPTDKNGQPMQPYLDEPPNDEWSNPLNYELTTDANTGRNTPRVWSNGPDGQNEQGGGDDITSWNESDAG